MPDVFYWLCICIYNVKILDNKKRNQIHHYSTVFVTCTIKTMYPLVNELDISTMNELILKSDV